LELKRAKRASDEIFKLDQYHAGTFVTLGNIYAAAGEQQKAAKVCCLFICLLCSV